MAISRANFKIPIHLVSSVPSVETYNNIQKKNIDTSKFKKDLKLSITKN